MNQAVTGWEQEESVPDGYRFNDYLHVQNGRLYYQELDLAQILIGGGKDQGLGRQIKTPLEIVYEPMIRQRIDEMNEYFAQAAAGSGYAGVFHYAYASKANAAYEVIRNCLLAGADYEMSSMVDVGIARHMIGEGLLPAERKIICNGFKPAGSVYMAEILSLRKSHEQLIPIIEDIVEIAPLAESEDSFAVGLRQKCYGAHSSIEEMDQLNSRFGLETSDIWRAAEMIEQAENLTLTIYHAMVGGQLTDMDQFIARLRPSMEIYAQLRQKYESLHIFNFGGGVPVAMTLDFLFDYELFAMRLMGELQKVCDSYEVPVPDIMGEFGRYTTAEHGIHIFKVLQMKENSSTHPWYIIDGSIMTSFPDSWALAEHFIVLPINHLDRPFRRVLLGGVTCDSDDQYPPKPSESPLYLPMTDENEPLYVGFFAIGAYQEMLGGVRGVKHCVLPEAAELLVDQQADGPFQFEILPGQTANEILSQLGYPNK